MDPAIPPRTSGTSVPVRSPVVRAEYLLLMLLVMFLIAVRVNFATHAGGLWRDEVHSVLVARDPSIPIWYDSFPGLWIGLLRCWVFLVGCETDATLRLLGLVVSLLALWALWWAPRSESRSVPWASLCLFAMHPAFVMYGTQVRGYALGVALELGMLGIILRLLDRPTRTLAYLLPVVSLLAVQAAYANSSVLLAASLAAGLVCWHERRWRLLAGLALNGIACAASMMPYALIAFPAFKEWSHILQLDHGYDWYLRKMIESLCVPDAVPVTSTSNVVAMALLGSGCILLLILAVRAGLRHSFSRETSPEAVRSARLSRFSVATIILGSLLQVFYMKWLSVTTHVWYYFPLMALWVFCIDIVPGFSATRRKVAVIVALAGIYAAWNASNARLTNVDLVARQLSVQAQSGDLIIVQPWYFGTTVARYYHGDSPWQTVPSINHFVYGFGQFKERMTAFDPLKEDLDRIRATLHSGGQVWVVSQFEFKPSVSGEQSVPPVRRAPSAWITELKWHQQLNHELQSCATRIAEVEIAVGNPVNPFENCRLFVVSGWREPDAREAPATELN